MNNNNYVLNTEINDKMSKTHYNDKGNKRGFSFKKNMNVNKVNGIYNLNNIIKKNDNYEEILNNKNNNYVNINIKKNNIKNNK